MILKFSFSALKQILILAECVYFNDCSCCFCNKIYIYIYICFFYLAWCFRRLWAYPFNTKPVNTYPFTTYPFNTYSMRIHSIRIQTKRYAPAGIAMYANPKQILANHCISRNRNEYQIIACHFISLLLGGNGNKNENFALASTRTFFTVCLSQTFSLAWG